MTYDLTGLPPTPEEVRAFAAEAMGNSRLAIESLTDRLLASPRYGEQWGRHWLDVVRFGESTGFERNVILENAWPFRDYVIRSCNEDKPFNRFIVEHLAGDVIGKGDPQVEVGTAFLVAGPYDNVGNADPVAQANILAATLDDTITATGSAFLGLTLNCARCHHHKFDPIPTEDYYRLRAAFEGVRHGDRVLATTEEKQRFAEATRPLEQRKTTLAEEKSALEKIVRTRADALPAAAPALRPAPDPMRTEETFAPVSARFVRMKILAQSSNAKSGGGAQLDEFEVWSAGRNVALASAGAQAAGASARTAEDFAEAYGPAHVIDGKFGARWFAGSPAELTITLARAETIDRVVFSNDRHSQPITNKRGRSQYPTEYEIFVSADGAEWSKVADSTDRAAADAALSAERNFRRAIAPGESAQLAQLDRALADVEKRLKAVPPLPEVWAGKFSPVKEPTRVHKGGDPMKPGDAVAPASLSVLDRVTSPFALAADAPESQRRLALAEWIASDANPLTARVLANRVWHYHFGTGLVDTPGDFGFLGSRPTHPELLDFLAQRLRAHGWRLKALHREIVLSQTYRQSSAARADAATLDQDARLLWRFPPRRLSAEEIRDTMLTAAGQLDLTMGGPGFRLYRYLNDNVSTFAPLDAPGPETYRRAVYHQNARASVVDVLSDFDLPDNTASAPRRASTTSPLQALTLLNHRFTLDMAEALAARIEGDTDFQSVSGDKEQTGGLRHPIRSAFAFAFQREPTAREIEAASALIAAHGPRAFCRALLNSNELLHLE